MKKVIYSVTKVTKQENIKISGIGYITDTDLITTCMSKKNTPYIRVFEDCIKDCHLVDKTTDQFKGSYFEWAEYDGREYQRNYYIWYKLV